LTDVADTETVFRLIQSIPSPKAEPFKLWIAKVARERIDEIEDPEIGINCLNPVHPLILKILFKIKNAILPKIL
jgi:hypothetical protein